MSIELVVFDMAGTTVRDDDAVNLCLREALAGHLAVSRAEANAVMGWPKPVAIRTLLEQKVTPGQPASNELVASIHSDFVDRMVRFYQTAPGVEPMPYAVDAFHQLKEAGVRIALDSGFNRVIVNAVLERLGWSEVVLLDATVASDEVAHGRPEPDMIFKAMELTGVKQASRVAKVGDTPSDLLEGNRAGCALVIGVTNGTHTPEQLKLHPHTHLLPSLQELARVIFQETASAHQSGSVSSKFATP